MNQTDEKNNQPIRYRAEVKRAKVVKKRGKAPSEKQEHDAVNTAVPTDAPSKSEPPKAQESVREGVSGSAQDQAAVEEAAATAAAAETVAEGAEEQSGDASSEILDYVAPHETYKEYISRKHKSNHNGNTKMASKEAMDDADSGYLFENDKHYKRYGKNHHRRHHHHHHKFKHLKTWKKVLIITVSIILVLIIAAVGSFFIVKEIGRHSLHDYGGFSLETPETDEAGNAIKLDNQGRVITYNGVSYQLNENIVSVAFIGADDGSEEYAKLKMADAIYIMAIDTESGEVKILSVSRDTMADVDLYSDEGKFIDTERMQIAFSYAYGNQNVSGGKNTTTSLSRLFYSLPFEKYFAINMDALIALNDTIGGVTLTSSLTFESPVDGRKINAGDTVTLKGEEADYYVRYRIKEELDSNNARMQRQQEYIRAFMNSVIPSIKKDFAVVTDLYTVVKNNSDTSLDFSEITYLASTAVGKLRNASDIKYVNLQGTITAGEYAELKVTNAQTLQAMLDVFYTPLSENGAKK